jgi:hypothetical protein
MSSPPPVLRTGTDLRIVPPATPIRARKSRIQLPTTHRTSWKLLAPIQPHLFLQVEHNASRSAVTAITVRPSPAGTVEERSTALLRPKLSPFRPRQNEAGCHHARGDPPYPKSWGPPPRPSRSQGPRQRCTAPDFATFGSVHRVDIHGNIQVGAAERHQSGAAAPLPVISKSEFARAIGVGRSAVGNMIRRQQISGDALVERAGRILVNSDVARRQLRDRLDVKQREINGRAKLGGDVIGEPDAPDPIMAALKSARLRQVELANAKAEEEAAVRSGRLALAADMRVEVGRVAGSMIAGFEGGLAELANAVTADTGANQRDVLVALRRAWRALRTRLAGIEAEAAANSPSLSRPAHDHLGEP